MKPFDDSLGLRGRVFVGSSPRKTETRPFLSLWGGAILWRAAQWCKPCQDTRPTILSFRYSLVSFLPQQQQQTIVNLHHNSRFASQILYRFKRAQIPHFWSLEICGVDSTPLTRLAPSRVHFLRHLYSSHPTSNSVTAKTSSSNNRAFKPQWRSRPTARTN
jgi:hypothetical protein